MRQTQRAGDKIMHLIPILLMAGLFVALIVMMSLAFGL